MHHVRSAANAAKHQTKELCFHSHKTCTRVHEINRRVKLKRWRKSRGKKPNPNPTSKRWSMLFESKISLLVRKIFGHTFITRTDREVSWWFSHVSKGPHERENPAKWVLNFLAPLINVLSTKTVTISVTAHTWETSWSPRSGNLRKTGFSNWFRSFWWTSDFVRWQCSPVFRQHGQGSGMTLAAIQKGSSRAWKQYRFLFW